MTRADSTVFHNGIRRNAPDKLRSMTFDSAKPDAIWMIGGFYAAGPLFSIFLAGSAVPLVSETCHYLLVLMPDYRGKSPYEWQDIIENHYTGEGRLTTIVVRTGEFLDWLKTGHLFAYCSWLSARRLFTTPELESQIDSAVYINAHRFDDSNFSVSMSLSHQFLAGAHFFKQSGSVSLAAFMLHQATEQALRAVLKLVTGYRSCTHNLERLLLYAGLSIPSLADFLFTLPPRQLAILKELTRSYFGSRYSFEFHLDSRTLQVQFGWVESILSLVEHTGRAIITESLFPKLIFQ